jgi:hypothetical protein
MADHKPGCEALGGYGHGVGPCTCGADTPAPVLTDEQIEDLIGSSDGAWHEDVFHIEGPALADLLRDTAETLAAQAPAQQAEPVTGQARMSGGEWGACTVEHVAMVQAAPEEWKDYEVRYLYTHPAPSHTAVMQQALDAIDAEMSADWTCNSYHPKLHAARAALSATLETKHAI